MKRPVLSVLALLDSPLASSVKINVSFISGDEVLHGPFAHKPPLKELAFPFGDSLEQPAKKTAEQNNNNA